MIANEQNLTTLQSFETEENKALFAEALLSSPNNAFEAAKKVFPGNMSYALYASNNWVHDDSVTRHQRRLLHEYGETKYLPSKVEVAREIHDISKVALDVETSLKALQLYCNVRGFIEKPGTVINNNAVCNKIMVIKDHGTDEQWEDKLQQQQQNLIDSSG